MERRKSSLGKLVSYLTNYSGGGFARADTNGNFLGVANFKVWLTFTLMEAFTTSLHSNQMDVKSGELNMPLRACFIFDHLVILVETSALVQWFYKSWHCIEHIFI